MVSKVIKPPSKLLTMSQITNEALSILNEEFQRSYETPAETAKRRRGMLLDRLRTRRLTEELSGEKKHSEGIDGQGIEKQQDVQQTRSGSHTSLHDSESC